MCSHRLSWLLTLLAPLWVVIGQSANGQTTSSAPAPAEEGAAVPGEPTVPASPLDAMAQADKAVEAAEKGGPNSRVAARRAAQLANYVLNVKREDMQTKADVERAEAQNARAKFVLGRVLLLDGRMRDALSYLKEYAASEGKADWLCFKLLGDIYFQGKYHRMALQSYEMAGRLNSRESKVFLGQARAELALGMRDEAAKHAQQAIDLDQERDPEPHLVLAQTQLQLKKYADAASTARRAIDLTRDRLRQEPGQSKWLTGLDNALGVMSEIQQTRLTANPEQGEVYVNLARVIQDRADLARLMAYHEAIKKLEEGIEKTAPNTPPDLLYETARLQYSVGRDEDARKTLDDLFKIQPDHAEGRQLKEKIEAKPPTP